MVAVEGEVEDEVVVEDNVVVEDELVAARRWEIRWRPSKMIEPTNAQHFLFLSLPFFLLSLISFSFPACVGVSDTHPLCGRVSRTIKMLAMCACGRRSSCTPSGLWFHSASAAWVGCLVCRPTRNKRGWLPALGASNAKEDEHAHAEAESTHPRC